MHPPFSMGMGAMGVGGGHIASIFCMSCPIYDFFPLIQSWVDPEGGGGGVS